MADILTLLQMRPATSAGFDASLAEAGDALVAAYLWGENSFNCEQFKKAALQKSPPLDTAAPLEIALTDHK